MRMLTTAEVAERLRTTARQVTIRCAKGEIRAIKEGRQWLVSEDDLADYLDEKANRPRRRRRNRAA
jgi:excisionase family DNA binding protein